jgi:4-nitrophenyl phosphatase
MVGDRLNTDILFGKNGGLTTLLVLTGSCMVSMTQINDLPTGIQLGITTEDDITGPNPSSIVPDLVTQTLGDFRIVEKTS